MKKAKYCYYAEINAQKLPLLLFLVCYVGIRLLQPTAKPKQRKKEKS